MSQNNKFPWFFQGYPLYNKFALLYNKFDLMEGNVLVIPTFGAKFEDLSVEITYKEDHNLLSVKRGFNRWVDQDPTLLFKIMKNFCPTKVELIDGELHIHFKDTSPQPQKLEINIPQPTAESHPQLLNEESDF
jgi:hypothetical protein